MPNLPPELRSLHVRDYNRARAKRPATAEEVMPIGKSRRSVVSRYFLPVLNPHLWGTLALPNPFLMMICERRGLSLFGWLWGFFMIIIFMLAWYAALQAPHPGVFMGFLLLESILFGVGIYCFVYTLSSARVKRFLSKERLEDLALTRLSGEQILIAPLVAPAMAAHMFSFVYFLTQFVGLVIYLAFSSLFLIFHTNGSIVMDSNFYPRFLWWLGLYGLLLVVKEYPRRVVTRALIDRAAAQAIRRPGRSLETLRSLLLGEGRVPFFICIVLTIFFVGMFRVLGPGMVLVIPIYFIVLLSYAGWARDDAATYFKESSRNPLGIFGSEEQES